MRSFRLVLLGWFIACSALGSNTTNVRLTSLIGAKVLNPESLKGESYVVEFFASWCGSCKGNMLPVSRLAGRENIRYLPVSIDESLEKARSFFKNAAAPVKPLERAAYLDVNGVFAKSLGVRGPAVVVVNEKGEVSRVLAGHISGSEISELEALLKASGK